MLLCVTFPELDRWGGQKFLAKGLDCLTRYGAQAKEVLPRLTAFRAALVNARGKEAQENLKTLDGILATIKAGSPMPTVINMKEFSAESR